ncbi:MAG: hypothetical protein JO157_06830, partial [Acetobacteraceae bacterium]|nr:hypothetical protein [Acetobacteraceae bacterium]
MYGAVLPGAVRKHEIQQLALLARFLSGEQPLRVSRQFEKLHALVHVGLLGGFVAVDLPLEPKLLRAPLPGEAVVEVTADLAVELIDVHGIDAIAQALVFGLKPADRRLVLPALVGVTGLKSLPYPGQHLVIEVQTAKQLCELRLQHFLADVFAPTERGLASAFMRIARAVILDVLLLL